MDQNAEIGLGTIFNNHTACAWLESTFLFVRLSKNPQHYKIEGDAPTGSLQERARLICSRDIDRLLQYDLASGERNIRPTEYGIAMSRYYVRFETMKLVMGLQEKAKISEIVCCEHHHSREHVLTLLAVRDCSKRRA